LVLTHEYRHSPVIEEIEMKKSIWLSGMVVLILSTAANAHTRLKASVPAEGSVVNAAPTSIVLTFSGAARVTALTIQKEGGAEQKLEPLPTAAAKEITVPVPKLAPGKYVVNWRVAGEDSHLMSGKLQFTVDPAAKPAAGKPKQEQEHEHAH
jgi:methionine-rich copper-binding protein CopC